MATTVSLKPLSRKVATTLFPCRGPGATDITGKPITTPHEFVLRAETVWIRAGTPPPWIEFVKLNWSIWAWDPMRDAQ